MSETRQRERERQRRASTNSFSFGSSKKTFSKKNINQQKISSLQRPFTVYTVRLRTSSSRDAEPDDPEAGVLLCLIAESGDAVIRRVSRVPDPEADADDAAEACAAASGRGANCDDIEAFRSVAAASEDDYDEGPRSVPLRRTRFQRGCVDEVSFAAPDLGSPLAAVVVSPQGGGFGGNSTWRVDEVSVATTSQRPGEPAARFVFKGEAAGGSRGALAAAAVPLDAVVVGAGERAAVLTKRQAEALRAAGLERYAWLKGRALATAAGLVVAGGALLLAGPKGGWEHPEAAAGPFVAGGAAGLLYGWLLQAGVDAVGGGGGGQESASAAASAFVETADEEEEEEESESDESDRAEEEEQESSVPSPPPPSSLASRLFSSAPIRALLVVGLGAALFSAANGGGGGGGVVGGDEAAEAAAAAVAKGGGTAAAAERLLLVRQLLAAAAGFSMYKVGLVATVAAADYSDAAAAEREKEREEERKKKKGVEGGGGGGESERQRRVTSISSDDEN